MKREIIVPVVRLQRNARQMDRIETDVYRGISIELSSMYQRLVRCHVSEAFPTEFPHSYSSLALPFLEDPKGPDGLSVVIQNPRLLNSYDLRCLGLAHAFSFGKDTLDEDDYMKAWVITFHQTGEEQYKRLLGLNKEYNPEDFEDMVDRPLGCLPGLLGNLLSHRITAEEMCGYTRDAAEGENRFIAMMNQYEAEHMATV